MKCVEDRIRLSQRMRFMHSIKLTYLIYFVLNSSPVIFISVELKSIVKMFNLPSLKKSTSLKHLQ